jgi:uncharacterized protein involved in exopolysaccharide biosynthesis
MSSAPPDTLSRPVPDELPDAPPRQAAPRRRVPTAPPPALSARGWFIVVAMGVLFAAAGVVVALGRHPTYTAESSMNVGAVNLRVQAQSGYTAGAEALASSYSRVAMSSLVVNPVARKLHLTPQQVSDRLTAAPVPDQPAFRILATGPSAGEAITLADAATKQMQSYADQASTGHDSAGTLLKRFQRQSGRAARLQQRYFLLKGYEAESKVTGATPEQIANAPSQKKLIDAQVAYETAQLKAQALSGMYAVRVQEVGDAPRVALLGRSIGATSDRTHVLEELGAAGLLAGLLIGAALALLTDRATARRRRFTTSA